MNMDDPTIITLQGKVSAAQQEFDMAVMFHEVWKPAAYDDALHARLGKSYATQGFLVARAALRREMLLALTRIWDTNKQSIRIQSVAADLRNKNMILALATDRADRLGLPEAREQMQAEIQTRASAALSLLNRYMEGGSSSPVLRKILALRNERLAHRQLQPTEARGADATDNEIEEFYQDSSTLIRHLLSLVNAVAYDPQEAANVYRHYAGHFWAGVRGE